MNCNYIYPNNDIFITSYRIDKSLLIIHLINIHNAFIDRVYLEYNHILYVVDIFSTFHEMDAQVELENEEIGGEPLIRRYSSNNRMITFDYNNQEILATPTSIKSLARRKRIAYIKRLEKSTSLTKEQIVVKNENHHSYWICACGKFNFFGDECASCHTSKEKIFQKNEYFSKDEDIKRNRLFVENLLLGVLIFLVILQMVFVNVFLGGDILYSNSDFKSLSSIIVRFIAPLLIVIFTFLIRASLVFNYKKLTYALLFNRLGFVVTLNAITLVSFVKFSYNFVFLMGLDACFIWYYFNLFKRKINYTYQYFISAFLVFMIIFSFGSVIHYTKYSFSVDEKGIVLNIKSNVQEYEVPEKINALPVYKIVFDGTNKTKYALKNITISNNLQEIEISSPAITPYLNKINLKENNQVFYLDDGVLKTKDKNKVSLIPNAMTSYSIDEEIITHNSYLNWTSLEEITISSQVKIIESGAFSGCTSLKNITFEENCELQEIGDYAFNNCASLENIVIPDTVTSMGIGVFASCYGLKNLTLPFIGNKQYDNTLTSNNNVFGYIFGGGYNFASTSKGINLDSVTITNQLILANASFYSIQAKTVILNPLGGSFPRNLFAYATIEEIVIPEGIEEIEYNCFAYCKSLKKVVFPSTLKKIDGYAFLATNALEEVDTSLCDLNNMEIIADGNETLLALLNK